MTRYNKGFSIVEIVIVVAVLALIGLTGWRVWDANQGVETQDQTDTTQTDTAPAVNSDEDLEKADSALDETNVEGSESQQLDTETSF
jgi:prepilin-type N-terminal cleavage/methylation domain-containing protein